MKNCPICNELLGDQVEQCFRCKHIFEKHFYCLKCNKPLKDEKSVCECGGWAVSPITHNNDNIGLYWTREELKANAKARLRIILWLAILACILLSPFTYLRNRITRSTPEGIVFSTYNQNGDPVNLYYNDELKGYDRTDDHYYTNATLKVFVGWLPITLYESPNIRDLQFIVFIATLLSIILRIFFLNPYEVGINRFFMSDLYSSTKLSNVLFAFNSKRYITIIKTMFLWRFIIFLWSLLLIVPGIMKYYEYYLVPYILSENPDITSDEAFRISRAMTSGSKWDLFVFDLSFILWELLSILTLGLANILWVTPYIQATKAQLYDKYRNYFIYMGRANQTQLPGYQGQ